MVLGKGVVSHYVAHEGVGIAEEIAGRQGGPEALASLAVEEENAVEAQKKAGVLPDLTVANPVLDAPRLQEAGKTQLRKDLQRFTHPGVPVGGQVALGRQEVRYEVRGKQHLVEIDGAGQLDAIVAHVACLNGSVLHEPVLHPDVPLLHVGSAHAGIDGEEGGSGIGQNSVAGGAGNPELGHRNGNQAAAADRAAESRKGHRLAQAVVAPHGVQHRGNAVVDHVVDAVAGPDDGPVPGAGLKGDADVGSEVVAVAGVKGPSVGGAGQIHHRVRVQHRLPTTHRQEGQPLGLVGHRVILPAESQVQAQTAGDPPSVSHVEVDEVLLEQVGVGGPVDIARMGRGGVERLTGAVDKSSQGSQKSGGSSKLAGSNPPGENIGHQGIGVSGTEPQGVGGYGSPVIELIHLGQANASAHLDGVVPLDPGNVVHDVHVAGVAPLSQKILDGVAKTAPQRQPVAQGKGLVGEEPGTRGLVAHPGLVGDVGLQQAGQGEGTQPALGTLPGAGQTGKDGVDAVEHRVGGLQAKLVENPGE